MTLRRFKPGKVGTDIDTVLVSLVRSSARHIPAYRDLLESSGVSASQVTKASDLRRLPITSKESFFHNAALRSVLHARVERSRCVQTRTSGFSGMPISIYMSKMEAFFRRAQIGASWRRFTRLPLPLRVADLGTWVTHPSGVHRVRRGMISILRISMGLPVDTQLELLARHDPHLVSGTPTAIDLLARGAARSGFFIRSARLIAMRGEVLYEPVRSIVEQTFRCRVADFYNCEEIGNIATECPIDPKIYHVNTDGCMVETVDDDGTQTAPEEEGRILLTNLYNFTMPFIRYDVGDRGTLLAAPRNGRCACGSRRPRMKLLGGREDDYVFLPGGRRVSPRLVGTAVYRAAMNPQPSGEMQWLFSGFQVIQDALDHMTVRIVLEKGQPQEAEERVSSALRALHPAFRCSVHVVDDLSRESSGKLKKVVCSVERCMDDRLESHAA